MTKLNEPGDVPSGTGISFGMNQGVNMKRILISILILMVSTSLAAASVVVPSVVPSTGSETAECAAAGCAGTSYYKFDDWSYDGSVDSDTSPDGVITIHDPNMTSFNWSSTKPVCAVIVKSSTVLNIYNYGSCDDGNPQYSDTQLVSPSTNTNGVVQDISHVTFCYCSEGTVGPSGEIPEFPSIALPVAAIMGIMFLFGRRKTE